MMKLNKTTFENIENLQKQKKHSTIMTINKTPFENREHLQNKRFKRNETQHTEPFKDNESQQKKPSKAIDISRKNKTHAKTLNSNADPVKDTDHHKKNMHSKQYETLRK